MSALFIYGLFVWGCVEGLRRPWAGLVMFFTFVALEPKWNWRWAIDTSFPYQKYLAACVVAGLCLQGFRRARVSGTAFSALACLIAFLGVGYIATLQSINFQYSLEYMSYVWKIVLMTTLTVWLIDTPRKIWILLSVLILCQGYNAFQINLQYFEDGFSRYAVNGWGVKGDNNTYSIFTVPFIAMSCGMAIYGRTLWQR
ncbi:MAG: DUF5935 domain-containing protein, partial [Planctomycetota bacterium]